MLSDILKNTIVYLISLYWLFESRFVEGVKAVFFTYSFHLATDYAVWAGSGTSLPRSQNQRCHCEWGNIARFSSEIHTRHIHALFEHKAEFLMLKLVVHKVTTAI
jgi:hypothetical protein